MTVNEIREKFLKYFEGKGHQVMSSSSLIPKDDPSVLLTTAGMQQFKDWFSGKVKPEHNRAATIQKCVRTGDIDEVGDETHLTFFEMLGNFSFGDYFKEEAIKWGYEFIASELGVSDERIHFTIFKGDKEVPRDNDSERIIKKIGSFKIEECDRADNFWGPTGTEGPCGPTVEIYVDGVEVWNLVFNEYYQEANKVLLPLETKGVDTGAGLERIAATLNRVESVFETDEFKEIVAFINGKMQKKDKKAERIIADHARTATFLIADGVRPSNLDKGYILRRVIRRIIRYARLTGITEQNICSEIAKIVIDIYKSNYPELEREQKHIIDELNLEEAKFVKVIEAGLKKFEHYEDNKEISGKEAFDLFATYGFPYELTVEMAKEKGIKIDQAGFEAEFEKHQEVSRKGVDKKFAGGLENKEDPKIIEYHTLAHLLLAALREVLGEHVHQKGANITAERLRFDFSHPEKMTDIEKQKVEEWVNDKLGRDLEVNLDETDPKTAKEKGAEGEFSSKYGDKVKVYTIGGNLDSTKFISKEICGGPHVGNLSEIKGRFRIKKEESSSAGVRRIKGVLE
ncbi:MAG: alanine--tRNA ligase [Patescibacteria group bacterium]|nr:alanine--tRNA ligase [Patescibacteria group bacterium]